MSILSRRESRRPELFKIFCFSSKLLFKLGWMEHLLEFFACVMIADDYLVSSMGVKKRLNNVPKDFDGKRGVEDKGTSVSAAIVVT